MFAGDNQQLFPTNFAQAARYLNGNDLSQFETNFDVAYFGSITNLQDPSRIIIFKEKQAWQGLSGKWFKTYSFADGHSEIHSEPDGNFDDWESERIVLPATNQ